MRLIPDGTLYREVEVNLVFPDVDTRTIIVYDAEDTIEISDAEWDTICHGWWKDYVTTFEYGHSPKFTKFSQYLTEYLDKKQQDMKVKGLRKNI